MTLSIRFSQSTRRKKNLVFIYLNSKEEKRREEKKDCGEGLKTIKRDLQNSKRHSTRKKGKVNPYNNNDLIEQKENEKRKFLP